MPLETGAPFSAATINQADTQRVPKQRLLMTYSKEEFIDKAWDVVGRKVSKARLLGDIYETARSSIGLPAAIDSPVIGMFRLVLAEGRSLIRRRDAQASR